MRSVMLAFAALSVTCAAHASDASFLVVDADGTVTSRSSLPTSKPRLISRSNETDRPTRFLTDQGINRKAEKLASIAMLAEKANQHGINFDLLLEIAIQESGLNSQAVSPKGAVGLMQVMPATGQRFGATNLYDPSRNIEAAISYLKYLAKLFGDDVQLILAAYNAGEGAVIKYGYRIPPYAETQNYVQVILRRLQLKELKSNALNYQ